MSKRDRAFPHPNSRIFSELFLYIKQYQPVHPWRVVVIYPTRSVERSSEPHFQPLLNLEQVTRIYLDELEEGENCPLGVRLLTSPRSKETRILRGGFATGRGFQGAEMNSAHSPS